MEQLMKDELTVDANFKLGDAWSVPLPPDLSVKRREPLRKSVGGDMLAYLTAENLALVFALRDSGILDWLKGKAYDVVWDYIKAVELKLPATILPRSATFELADKNGTVLRASIPKLDPSAIERTRVRIREELSAGKERREILIEIESGESDE
jgi:hypothetical protein